MYFNLPRNIRSLHDLSNRFSAYDTVCEGRLLYLKEAFSAIEEALERKGFSGIEKAIEQWDNLVSLDFPDQAPQLVHAVDELRVALRYIQILGCIVYYNPPSLNEEVDSFKAAIFKQFTAVCMKISEHFPVLNSLMMTARARLQEKMTSIYYWVVTEKPSLSVPELVEAFLSEASLSEKDFDELVTALFYYVANQLWVDCKPFFMSDWRAEKTEKEGVDAFAHCFLFDSSFEPVEHKVLYLEYRRELSAARAGGGSAGATKKKKKKNKKK